MTATSIVAWAVAAVIVVWAVATYNRLRTLKAKREAAEAEGLVRRVAYLEEWIGRLESSPLRRSRMSV